MEARGVVLTPWERKCIGILWILTFAPAVFCCPDFDNATMNCDIPPVKGLNCTYVKGTPKDPPINDYHVPSAVGFLGVETAYVSRNKECHSRLNITWKMPQDGSLDYLRGFYLNISFFYKNQTIFLHRTFSVSATSWQNISKTTFRHECVTPAYGTEYRIELYSLPMNLEKFNRTVTHHTASNVSSYTPCNREGTPSNSSSWIATMWTGENPSDGSIDVCFYTAPPTYNFTKYVISLLPNHYDPLNKVVDQKEVSVDVFKDLKICQKFMNVCSGVYKIWVMPKNEPWCTCRSVGQCMGSCTATVVESIDMTSSVCTPTTTALPTTVTAPRVLSITIDNSTEHAFPTVPTGGKLAGIVIGVLLAGIIVASMVLVLLLYRRRKGRQHFDYVTKEPKPALPSYPIDHQQTVLLIYSSDNEHHRKVVRNFAAFLHSCCKCDVRFDDWSQVDISQTNALDWLTKQLHQVKHIIVINSLGAFMQHKAWIEGATCKPVKELLLPDMFIPALRQIQARVYDPTSSLHYYHVYFPYTDVKHLLSVSFGQRYKLMKRIEDLFLNIHGMTKHSSKGKTSASQINAEGYTSSIEGQALKAAIEEACVSFGRNPNWFQECFSYKPPNADRDMMLVKHSPVNGKIHHDINCQPLTVDMMNENDSSRPSSFNSTKSSHTTKSSDEGLHSDPEIMPPSSEGSCSSELDRWRGSLDMGIGNGIDDSTFDPNSPTIPLGFCPPVPDDDEETSSMASRVFYEKFNELNDQYDSGIPYSSFDFKTSDRSSC